MNHVEVNYAKSEDFVRNQQANGSSVRWDGWTMVFFVPAARAIYTKDGVRHNDKWGFETRVSPDTNGIWSVPKRYVKSARRTRARS